MSSSREANSEHILKSKPKYAVTALFRCCKSNGTVR